MPLSCDDFAAGARGAGPRCLAVDSGTARHLATCDACLAAVAAVVLDAAILDAHEPDERAPRGPIASAGDPDDMADEVALHLAGLGDGEVQARVRGARRDSAFVTLMNEVRAMAPPLLLEASPDAVVPADERCGVEPVSPVDRAGRRAWMLAGACVVLLALGFGVALRLHSTTRVPAVKGPLIHRGDDTGVGLLVQLGDDVPCAPAGGHAPPCPWHPAEEQLHFEYWLESGSPYRYVLVIGIGEEGEVSPFVTDGQGASRVIGPTDGLVDDWCQDDICWLEGGRYRARPGRLDIVTIFSEEPVPIDVADPRGVHLSDAGSLSVLHHALEVR